MSRVVYAWVGQDYRGNILIGRKDREDRALWHKDIPLTELDRCVLEVVARESGTQVYYTSPGSTLLARAFVVLEGGVRPEGSSATQ